MRRLSVMRVILPFVLLGGLLGAAWLIRAAFPVPRSMHAAVIPPSRLSGPETVARVLALAGQGVSDFALAQGVRPKVVGAYLTTRSRVPRLPAARWRNSQEIPETAPVWVVRVRVPWDTRVGDGRMYQGKSYRPQKMAAGILEVHVDARRSGRGIISIAPYRTEPGPLVTRVEVALRALWDVGVKRTDGDEPIEGPVLASALLVKNGASDRQLLGSPLYRRKGWRDTWMWRVGVKGPFRVDTRFLSGPPGAWEGQWIAQEVSWADDARRNGYGNLANGLGGLERIDRLAAASSVSVGGQRESK